MQFEIFSYCSFRLTISGDDLIIVLNKVVMSQSFNNHRLGEFYVDRFSENERSVIALNLIFNLLTFFFSTLIFRSVLLSISIITFPFCASQRTQRLL
jgi:hypothetical protein